MIFDTSIKNNIMDEFTRDIEELVIVLQAKKSQLYRNLKKNYRENIQYSFLIEHKFSDDIP